MSVDEGGWTVAETPGILWNLCMASVYRVIVLRSHSGLYKKCVNLPLPIPDTDWPLEGHRETLQPCLVSVGLANGPGSFWERQPDVLQQPSKGV